MNNFRHPHPKFFVGRGPEMPPWMAEEEFMGMRRQNPQFHSAMPNMPPNMHPPFLNQGNMLSSMNKNFMNSSSCKMPNSNFTRCPNPETFKPPHLMHESFQNRFVGNRFPNNSYSQMNMQHKINDGMHFKDFVPPNVMSSQSHKNDGFSENISKPLFPVRPPQENFSCMQTDQTQFHSKYDNSRVFQDKGFPFSNDKNFQSQNPVSVSDSLCGGSNFPSYKPNFRAPSLFPAYTPKDTQDECSKNLQQSTYNSDCLGKSTYCEKTSIPSTCVEKSSSYCDKLSTSVVFSKNVEPFQGKTESFQNKSEPFQDKTESFQERNAVDKIVNELFPPNTTISSFIYEKQPLKTVSNSQISHDSYKTLEDPVSLPSNSKYTYPPENQQSCFQSSDEIPLQRTQNVPVLPNHSSAVSSKDCLMQNAPFTSQSEIQQNVKETFSSFNFESNISTTDIADLLPGFDAFLKEHLEKPEESIPKQDTSKSVPNSAFSDDEWSKHSIPFIGENQTLNDNNVQNNSKDLFNDQLTYTKERSSSDQFDLKSEKSTELQFSALNQVICSLSAGGNPSKAVIAEKEASKVRSALEEAIELLVTNDAIVGLDYIIEYKKNIAQTGSIPFRCKLCNSAITRPSIIDHILGSKHRMRYLKTKDESKYDYIISLKLEKSERDAKIAEAAFELEKKYGRGCVIVDTVEYQKDSNAENSSKEMEEGTVEPVFTLDKIPIGFEALSPQHEEINTEFSLTSNIDQVNQSTPMIKKETPDMPVSAEIKKDVPCSVSSETAFTLPGLGSDLLNPNTKSDSSSVIPQASGSNEVLKLNNLYKESSTKELKQCVEHTPVKRSLSPEVSCRAKLLKTDVSDDSKPHLNPEGDHKLLTVSTEENSSEKKGFSLNILEQLSKSTISCEEEASVAVKVVNILMELLLRYKLQHFSVEKVENLMKSLQTKSPESIEDLSFLLKDCNIVESKTVEVTSSVMKDNENMLSKSNLPLEDMSRKQLKEELSNQIENNNVSEIDLLVKSTSDHCGSDSLLSSKALQPVPDVTVNNASFSGSQNTNLVTLDNVSEVTKNFTEVNCVSQASISPVSSNVGLMPPPFFGWPQTSEAATKQVSYANVQGSQNMIWTSPYQHTQTQYAHVPYYQQQNYGNTYSGAQAYQNQFSVLPQNSVPLKMAQPPLPPPPPPPPPAPNNPPLPPLPNSSMYPSHGNSHSLPSVPACTPMYSKQPRHPPPLP